MNNNTWGWVVGIIVIILIVLGLWWWVSQPASTATSASTTASTTAASTDAAPVVPVNESGQSVASIVAGLSGASQYQSLFSSTGINSTLIDTGPASYTVFVSTDAGYNLLPAGTIANMTAAQQKRMVQYSIVSGEALDVNTQDSGSIKTLSGDEVNFSVGSTGLVQVNSSYALAAYKGSNGIVYVLNQPLLPPTSGNIMTP